MGAESAHFLELLGVVGGQAGEDDHAEAAQDEVQGGAFQEHVHQGGDDHPMRPMNRKLPQEVRSFLVTMP